MTVSLGQLLPPTECTLISSVEYVAYTSVPELEQNTSGIPLSQSS